VLCSEKHCLIHQIYKVFIAELMFKMTTLSLNKHNGTPIIEHAACIHSSGYFFTGVQTTKNMHFHIMVAHQIFHVLAHIKFMSLRSKEPLCNQSINHERNYHQDIFSLSGKMWRCYVKQQVLKECSLHMYIY
jgi:hypothetical protein